MSKSSLIIGILVAAVAHAALLWPWSDHDDTVTKAVAMNPPKIAVLPEQKEPPATHKPIPIPQPKTVTPPAMKEIVKAATNKDVADRRGNTTTKNEDDSLPSLRIIWESAEQLRSVAHSLGMKIVAVNRSNEVVGELATIGNPRLIAFNGQLAAYSNRVRTLPRGFFGSSAVSGREVASFWILVPAHLDSRFVILQKYAIRRQGLRPANTRAVEAEFHRSAGSYKLVVTHIVPS